MPLHTWLSKMDVASHQLGRKTWRESAGRPRLLDHIRGDGVRLCDDAREKKERLAGKTSVNILFANLVDICQRLADNVTCRICTTNWCNVPASSYSTGPQSRFVPLKAINGAMCRRHILLPAALRSFLDHRLNLKP